MKKSVAIEAWVPFLNEVGSPILSQAEHVKRKVAAVEAALHDLQVAREALLVEVQEQWNTKEINQAKKQAAAESK